MEEYCRLFSFIEENSKKNIVGWGDYLASFNAEMDILEHEHFSCDFHLQLILEMCRIAEQVNFFSILNLEQEVSPYLGRILKILHDRSLKAEVREVGYELQRNGNQVLSISRNLSSTIKHDE